MIDICEKTGLYLVIYEYANAGNEELFIGINDKVKGRWISLLNYGMDSGEFKIVNAV